MLWHWFGAMVWRMNIARIDIARMWPGVYARTGLTLACSQREKVGAYAACQCLHWPPFMSCTLLYVPPTYRATLPHTYTYIHSYIHTYIHTYVRMYIQTYIRTYVHAYYLFTYFHTQSFTTSFVFPSFSDPATTFETHYWKKLTCGVIRSFNFPNLILP